MITIDGLLKREDLIEVGRKAVEDTLIDFRDSRISLVGMGNGLVVCEEDGTKSDAIRLTIDDALRIALEAIIKVVS